MTERGALRAQVALVTGGSRGVGKGIAEALSEAGATVYVTGRTVANTEFSTKCVPIPCDHTDDAQVMESARYLDLSNSESPQFVGRAVAALAADPDVLATSGSILVAAACAEKYGFADVDGKRPKPLNLGDV